MVNLLAETLKELSDSGKTESDVKWVGLDISREDGYYTTWEQFKIIAKDIEYSNGYGSEEIDISLIISGDGWWLERREYDGSEWWTYCTVPEQPKILKDFNTKDVYHPYSR